MSFSGCLFCSQITHSVSELSLPELSVPDDEMIDVEPVAALERRHWWGTDRIQPIYGEAR